MCARRLSGIAGRDGCSIVFGGSSRRIWLTILAVGNLVLWVAVAAGVGLLASEQMNMGLERFLREHQATAVARLNQPPAARPGAVPGSAGSLGVQASGVEGQALGSALTSSPGGVAEPQAATGPGTPAPMPGGQGTKSQDSGVLGSSPLVLSDPGFNSLGQVDAEMAHSTIGRQVQIRYGEAALNREIATMVAQSPELGFRDVQVNLDRDRAVVTGDVMVLGLNVGAEVQGVVVIEDCLPRVELQSVSVGGWLTPGFVKDQVAETVLGALDWYPPDSALCLERIVLEDGAVTVYGHRR